MRNDGKTTSEWFNMKKLKPSSSATSTQPVTKPVMAGTVQGNPFSFGDEFEAARRFPTVFELAQIAAILNGNKNWCKFVPKGLGNTPEESVEKSALGLWQQCREVVITALIGKYIGFDQRGEVRHSYYTPMEIALRTQTFPLKFEYALKVIIGEKTRRADRYKLFRRFLQDNHGSWSEQKSDVGFEAEEIFAKVKAEGFNKQDLQKCAACFFEWRAKQKTLKARRAADTRWAAPGQPKKAKKASKARWANKKKNTLG